MQTNRLLVFGVVLSVVFCGCEKTEVGTEPEEKKEAVMAVTIQWLGHASFKIKGNGEVVYIDPWKLGEASHDATVVLVSHSHYDHYSAQDVAKVSGPDTKIFGPGDVIAEAGKGQVIKAAETVTAGGVRITGVASYNPAKQFHPKANNWLGFVIEIGTKRIYYAIDVALLPVGGTYTMNAEEAAAAAERIKPAQAIPYHWGDIVGGANDADQFAETASCEVIVLKPGQSVDL
ncbi:MAG: MBL fold metallo-hydrolase [Planctomycetota bacterium]|jgi:L-ascorbate metabolism protein UlaG (beta-lactamase superfamily)